MPNWAGSSWYFLRYTDAHNDKEFASREALDYWTPLDWYNGGMEHTTLHLLYSRFWHKFLFDLGLVPTSEPYMKRTSHGMILGQNPHYVGNVSTEEEKQALIEKYVTQPNDQLTRPETVAGLPTPRPAAEIEPGATARDVLERRAGTLRD